MSTPKVSQNDGQSKFTPLIGLQCHYFKWFQFHTLILFLDMPDNPPPEWGLTRWRLYIECEWRVINELEAVVCSSEDPDELIFPGLSQIKGEDVKRIEFTGFNFRIDFTNGHALKVLTTLKPYEQWELRGSNGYRFGLRDNFQLVEDQDSPD
jgi:hypothetical protein